MMGFLNWYVDFNDELLLSIHIHKKIIYVMIIIVGIVFIYDSIKTLKKYYKK